MTALPVGLAVTIQDNNRHQPSWLSNFPRRTATHAATFQIFIKNMCGRAGGTTTLNVESTTTVDVLIKMMEHETGNPYHDGRLIFAGKQLERGRTLADYNIEKESTFQLVTRLKGGMYHESSGRVDNDQYHDVYGGCDDVHTDMSSKNLCVAVFVPGVGKVKRTVKPGVKLAELLSDVVGGGAGAGCGGGSGGAGGGGGGGGGDASLSRDEEELEHAQLEVQVLEARLKVRTLESQIAAKKRNQQ